jgi:hypothetical protein
MSNPQAQPPTLDCSALKKEYSCTQFNQELKATISKAIDSLPLFSKYLFLAKSLVWLASWFISVQCLALEPEKVLYSFQLWRVFTAPLVTESFISTFNLWLPAYLLLIIGPLEWKRGTLYVTLYCTMMAVLTCLVKSAIYLPIVVSLGPHPTTTAPTSQPDQSTFEAFKNSLTTFDSNDILACLVLIELYMFMMRRPDEPFDLIWCKVARKFVTLAVWVVVLHTFLGFEVISVIATAFVG